MIWLMYIKTSIASYHECSKKGISLKYLQKKLELSISNMPLEENSEVHFSLSLFQFFPMKTNHVKAFQLQLLDLKIPDNFDMPLMM